MSKAEFGISAFAAYVPPYRVDLREWCDWTGNSWDKTRAVIGESFRVPGVEEDVYTMAANAVLALIERNGVDPAKIGYLALGTESSVDNATGAVIVRGLVDRALAAKGKPRIARDCEVPEFKQACLAGVYGTKSGEIPGYAFSDAMKAAKLTWDDATLDTYLTNPMKMVPGTKMTFAGLSDPAKRKDVVWLSSDEFRGSVRRSVRMAPLSVGGLLRSRLFEQEMQKRNTEKQRIEDSKSDIEWGHQIRSYVLDQSRIKDLRTNVEIGNTQGVLDGDLDVFITASLKSGL